MRKAKKITAMFFVCLLVLALLPMPASANAAEPPCFVVLVNNAPKDLSLSLRLPDGTGQEPIALERDSRAWEGYFRFYTFMLPGSKAKPVPKDSDLLVEMGGESFTCPLPDVGWRYHQILVLNLEERALREGGPWRGMLLAALRIGLTLLIEGLAFWGFGYRSRGSWIVFFLTNLVTQGLLNGWMLGLFSTTNSTYPDVAFFLLGIAEILVFLVEAAAYSIFLRESTKGRSVLCSLIANAASFAVGGLVITFLPL